MSAQLLKGAPVAQALDGKTRERAQALRGRGVVPMLGIVRVGERPDDVAYERSVMRRAEKVGIEVRSVVLDERADQEALLAEIAALNDDARVHGILLFRPLPAQLDEKGACEAISPAKDVDAATPASLTGVFTGTGEGFAPCTAQACIEVLDHYGIALDGARVVVVGRSLVIGKPVAMLALDRNATVSIAHSHTSDLAELTRGADIVIACVGHARLLDAAYFAPGQAVLDVGINFVDGQRSAGRGRDHARARRGGCSHDERDAAPCRDGCAAAFLAGRESKGRIPEERGDATRVRSGRRTCARLRRLIP